MHTLSGTTGTAKSHFGFIGFGLIGGSIAHAIRNEYPHADIMAYNYYKNRRHPKLEQALSDGILTRISTGLQDFNCCDVIFLCAPVLTNIAYLKEVKPFLKKDCILTDVGSVKGDIHRAVSDLALDSRFIGGHPMNGSEKTGYNNSDASYLKKCYYVLTPTKETPAASLNWLENFLFSAGAQCVIMEPDDHDRVTAGISHAPHVISAALVNAVAQRDTDGRYALLAAGGFKDITRISSSSPEMWQNICLTNKNSILSFLEEYLTTLKQARDAIADSDEETILELFRQAKCYRDQF